MFQLYLPGIERNVQTKFHVKGILTPQRWAHPESWGQFKTLFKKNPIQGKKEFEELVQMLGTFTYDALGNLVENTGILTLLPHTAKTYFPENFFPRNWIQQARQNHNGSGRKVYFFEAIKLDGTRQRVFAKAPKESYSISGSNTESAFGIRDLQVYRTSQSEIEVLTKLEASQVSVSKPLAIFQQGHEQYSFVVGVEGKNPLELLSEERSRHALWMADATLLAGIFKAGYKHWAFFSHEFDDKIWRDGRLILIDVDETKDIQNYWPIGNYFKKHPDKLPDYFRRNLQDCLHEYVSVKLMHRAERLSYATRFMEEMNYGGEKEAREAVAEIDEYNAKNPSGWITEESYVSLCSDCD